MACDHTCPHFDVQPCGQSLSTPSPPPHGSIRVQVVETLEDAMRGCARGVALTGKQGGNFRLPNLHIHEIPGPELCVWYRV